VTQTQTKLKLDFGMDIS